MISTRRPRGLLLAALLCAGLSGASHALLISYDYSVEAQAGQPAPMPCRGDPGCGDSGERHTSKLPHAGHTGSPQAIGSTAEATSPHPGPVNDCAGPAPLPARCAEHEASPDEADSRDTGPTGEPPRSTPLPNNLALLAIGLIGLGLARQRTRQR